MCCANAFPCLARKYLSRYREAMQHNNQQPRAERSTAVVSQLLPDGGLVELLYDKNTGRTRFARHHDGVSEYIEQFAGRDGRTCVPVSPKNNLIRHDVLLLPECATPFGSCEELVHDIMAYIDRYLDLSEDFRAIATAYILLSWVYDAFNELPYLRFRGDFGSGKTRALLVVGSICYKPFFASGASTVSPIFYTLDTFGATLIADETDFRFSDERAELVKIFNNGNVRGFPVLRSAVTPQQTFDPRAFNVFGPKIVAMRNSFDDPALESRFLTEDMGKRPLRADIPINLPDVQRAEATLLRNKLLHYRFTTRHTATIDAAGYDARLSPRLNQIMAPLLAVAEGTTLRAAIMRGATKTEDAIRAQRSGTSEALVLEVLCVLWKATNHEYLTVAAITDAFIARYGSEFVRPITPRYIGQILRTRLRLYTYKRHGIFVLPLNQEAHLLQLAARYAVSMDGGISESTTDIHR